MPSWGCKGPGWDRDARVNSGRARVGAGTGGRERQGPASPQDAPWGHKPRPYTLTHTHTCAPWARESNPLPFRVLWLD